MPSNAVAETLRFGLAFTIVSMALLGVAALRRRRLSLVAFTWWGLLAVCVPLVGPFLAILWGHPATVKHAPKRSRRRRKR